jgi:hypothetical protein
LDYYQTWEQLCKAAKQHDCLCETGNTEMLDLGRFSEYLLLDFKSILALISAGIPLHSRWTTQERFIYDVCSLQAVNRFGGTSV